MLNNNMPADNTAAKQRRREFWQIEAMRRKWEAGIQPVNFMVVLRCCLLIAALLTGSYSMDGHAWFFIIVFVLVSIAIALPSSPSWPERIDCALSNYQPVDIRAFHQLQNDVKECGELTPDLLGKWLEVEYQSLIPHRQNTVQYTFTSRIIRDDKDPSP